MNVCINYDLSDGKIQNCAKCEKQISDRYFLKALNLFWHEDCLKCDSCNCRLCDLATTFYIRENFLLCRSDYMRFYGNTGLCSACNKLIPAFEMVMRAKRNIYHLECFACQQCSHRFCVGDRFYLCENKILCESDFDIRQHILKDNSIHQRFNNNNNSKLINLNQNINNNNNDNDNIDYINNNTNNNNNSINSLNFCGELKQKITPKNSSIIDKKRSTTNVDVFIGAK